MGNENNIPELWPGQKSTTTWEKYSFGGGFGGEVGAKWFSTTITLLNSGKPLIKVNMDEIKK